jgi:hypothetical protein
VAVSGGDAAVVVKAVVGGQVIRRCACLTICVQGCVPRGGLWRSHAMCGGMWHSSEKVKREASHAARGRPDGDNT